MILPARADFEPGILWGVAIAYWLLRRVIDRAKSDTPVARRETEVFSEADRARGAQTTQEEAEELERWLREKLGGATTAPAPLPRPIPAPVAKKRDPIPAPRPKPRPEAGPLGRRAPVSLESHDEVEERSSFEEVRAPVSYDELYTEREAPKILNLDAESAFAEQRRINEAERRNRAHSAADHDAFHTRIASPETHASDLQAQLERRRRAVRAAWISGEVLGQPVGLRRPS